MNRSKPLPVPADPLALTHTAAVLTPGELRAERVRFVRYLAERNLVTVRATEGKLLEASADFAATEPREG